MLLSPNAQRHLSVLWSLLTFSAVSAAFAGISIWQPFASASTLGRATVTRRAPGISAVAPAGSTIVVNTTSDVLSGSDGLCTLREAIGAANSNTASGGAVGECAAGSASGSDTIDFSANGTINLTTALPNISSDMTIDGPGAGLLTVRRDTGGDYRIFNITFGTVEISGLTVANGKTADGSPGNFGTNAQYGGGILNVGTLTLTDVELTGNRTGAGGAGLNFGGSGGSGGALANTGTVTMTNCSVTGNITGNGGAGNAGVGDGGRGGGIYSENNLTMTNCSVNGNTTGDPGTAAGANGKGGEGGGIYSRVGVLTLTNVTVNNNITGSTPPVNASSSIGGGGGIFTVLGTATLTNCTISGNQTGTGSNGDRGYGGGINNECPMTITGSTISGNTGNQSGAILNRRALTLTNSTVSGNHGTIAINNSDSTSSLRATNSTISANDGMGVIANGGLGSFVRNSIIAGNGSPGTADVEGSFTSQGNNLIGINASGLFGGGGFTDGVNNDKVGTSGNPLDARLATLGSYGGASQTHALLPGSPALDAGNNCVTEAAHCSDANIPQLTTDQRGFNRVVNVTVDMGAFESRGFTVSATSGTPQSTAIGSTFGSPLVATVSSSFAEPVANGVITFSAPTSGASGTFPGSVTSTTASANGGGVATSPAFTANLIGGSYNVTAGGTGIPVSATFSLTNLKAASSTSVSSSANPLNFGESVTFTATITAGVSLTPTGTVQFKDGVSNIGSPVTCVAGPGNTCTAQFSISTLSVGSHSISASYSGDTNLDPSNGSLAGSQVVNCVSIVVSNTNDSGAGSLRHAILGACPGGTITFAAGLTSGGPATIVLTSGELLIDKNLTITGPGANLLSVSGNGSSRIFNVQAGMVVISGLSIINGTLGTGESGGGILNRASLTLISCAITGNTAPVAGGGIQNSANNAPATLTVINSTISGNEGSSFGSGIFNGGTGGATVNLINSTVAANTDTSFGGGIYNSGSSGTATLNITNSTIAGNRAGSTGGGIYNFGNGGAGTVNLNNSIVADNVPPTQSTEGPDIFNFNGNLSGNNNIIENSGGHTITGSNNSNVDPLLVKDGTGTLILKNNGGPTSTLLPRNTSPALNAGSNSALPSDSFDLDGDANTAETLPVDQRGPGFSRVLNTTVDIGAVEVSYAITATAGSPQSATISTAFATQLQATVQESGINQSGIAVTFTAPVSGASGSFSSSATVNTDASGIATAPVFTANGTAGGPYNVVASLAGGSPAANFSLTNLKVATTTSVSSSVNPSEFGQSVTFTAIVSSSAGAPTGSVQFKDGGANLGAAQTLNVGGVAQLTISSLTSGTHSISAEYLGNDTWIGSTGTLQDGQVVKPQPTLSINDVSITEGNSGTTNLTFTVTLSAASNLTVSAKYDTADGVATTADNDYQLTSDTLTFNPGDSSLTKTVTVFITGDQKTEPDETVFVVLSNPVNAAFSDSQGQGTILNDDTLRLLLDTSGPDANQLAALDSLLLVRDPFRVLSAPEWWNLGADQNTRVIIFAANLTLNPGETAADVTVTLNQTPNIVAEDVRAVPDSSFTQIRFRLPDGLPAGNCLVTITAQGRTSNTGSIGIAP